MRALSHIAQFAYISCIVLILLTAARPARAVSLPMPTGTELTATVRQLDANLFAAYNDCDLASFARYIAPHIQFYHDKSGLTVGRSKLVAAIRTNICGKLRRVLVPGTLAVYPIPGYGALETGANQFCEVRTGNCNFFSKFSQLWQYRHGTWLLSIAFSYDHHTGSRTGGHTRSHG
jgi:Domain of unknown function (DUF4440)